MNTYTYPQTNTRQILNVLQKRPLSFQELSKRIEETDEALSEDINQLVNRGVVSMRFHDHHVLYKLKKNPQ